MQKPMEKSQNKAQRVSVGELGLNLSGNLRMCREQKTPLLITTRRKVTHALLPIGEEAVTLETLDDGIIATLLARLDDIRPKLSQKQ